MSDPIVAIQHRSFRSEVKLLAGIISLLFVVLLAIYLWLVYFVGPWSSLYEFHGRFEQLPPSDEPLIAVIETTPRVIEDSVEVERQDDGTMIVRFGFGGPLIPRPMPNVDSLCARLGYEGPVEPFREVPHRARTDALT